MYTFKVNKSPESSTEEFENAVISSRNCIESILENEFLSVIIFEDTIAINSIDTKQPIEMTLSECKEKIKGCFLDSSGKIYPEFKRIDAIKTSMN